MRQSFSTFQMAVPAAMLVVCLILPGCGDSGTGGGSTPETSPTAALEPASPAEPAPAQSEVALVATETPAAVETPAAAPVSEMPAAGSVAEKPAAVPAAEVAVAETIPEAEGAAPEPAPQPEIDAADTYGTYCTVCHRTGLNGAPKYGSHALWGPRTARGRDAVYANALNGLRAMPPRGGVPSLSDEQVKAAVDYMVNGSGGWGAAP